VAGAAAGKSLSALARKVVSPEGIVPARNEPQASCGAPEAFRGEPILSEAKNW
jgi:hypothetical protein